MPEIAFVVADGRGALVHVRRKDNGECVGCIEKGLFETVRLLILSEFAEKGVDRWRLRSFMCSLRRWRGDVLGR